MANTFQTTSKIEKAVAFQWTAFEGFSDHLEFHNDELPSSVDNTGYSKLIRRPSRHKTQQIPLDRDYNLPGNVGASINYGEMKDASFPFAIVARFETNLQVSIEEMMFQLDAKDVMDRHLTPAIIDHRNQINQYIAQYIEAAAGNTVLVDGSKTAEDYITAIFKARQIQVQRAGAVQGQDKSILFNPNVLPVLGLGNAKLFHADAAGSQFASAELSPIAGFKTFESPTLATPTYTDFGLSAVVATDYDVTGRNTATWTPTWNLGITGGTANAVIKAGTKIKFMNGSTNINWTVAGLPTSNTGVVATFTVVSDCTLNASGAAVMGTNPLILSEAFISGGDFQNVTAALVANSTKVLAVTTPATVLSPSYAFTKDSIWLGSPVPDVVGDKVVKMKVGGFNLALLDDHYPGTQQKIHKLISFLAIGVAKPEALVTLY